MKKLLSLSAALLLCFLAHSQEAEVTGNYAEVTIIPRLDLNPFIQDSELGFTHGNSSIYTLFEGSAGEHFSWTLVNHWISSLNEPASPDYNYGWPYVNLGYSNTLNLIDYLCVDLTFGNWDFTIGKDAMFILGHEFQPWDWEIHYDLLTPFNSVISGYQWGIAAAYTTNSENTTIAAQWKTSPYGERPFASGLYAYSLQWTGEYGFYEPIWSYSAIQYDKKSFQHLVTLGNKFNFSDEVFFVAEWTGGFAKSDPFFDDAFADAFRFNCVRGEVGYVPSDRFDLGLHAYWHKPQELEGWFNVGAAAHFRPIKNNPDLLRLHAVLAYNTIGNYLGLTLGATFNIGIRCW